MKSFWFAVGTAGLVFIALTILSNFNVIPSSNAFLHYLVLGIVGSLCSCVSQFVVGLFYRKGDLRKSTADQR